jgi:integrase
LAIANPFQPGPCLDPDRLGGRGIGIHSLRKTAINDAIRNGASLHEVREFAGHADIRTTEVWLARGQPVGTAWDDWPQRPRAGGTPPKSC